MRYSRWAGNGGVKGARKMHNIPLMDKIGAKYILREIHL